MKFLFQSLIIPFLLIGWADTIKVYSQMIEICDNGIDDDGNGRIDLNDSDCYCPTIELVSLIPNPSFEDQKCCPQGRSQMECATTWIQASLPTTDYIHTCGWLGWEDSPMPLPVPDGEGAVGFRDGLDRDGEYNPNFKEYAGACLIRPLRAGFSYKFQFNIGFSSSHKSPPIYVTFFGTEDCKNLPFGVGNETFGCPSNGPDWIQLGSVLAIGENEWRQYEIDVIPTTDIYAMTIGPPCQKRSTTDNPYYFFDNLVLAEASAFEFDIQAYDLTRDRPLEQYSDQLCSTNLGLKLPEYDTLTYQWYKDGVALIGEQNALLKDPPGSGRYLVTLESAEGCVATKIYDLLIPVKRTKIAQRICEQESYLFNNESLTRTGIYWDTLKNAMNCDSIIELYLQVDQSLEDTVLAKIFPSESYKVGNTSFGLPGNYRETITSSFGCDSTVNLTLDFYQVYIPSVFSPNGDGVNDLFTINGGTELKEITNFCIYDRWGNELFTKKELILNDDHTGWNGQTQNRNVSSGVYIYTANLSMDDGLERAISGMITLVR